MHNYVMEKLNYEIKLLTFRFKNIIILSQLKMLMISFAIYLFQTRNKSISQSGCSIQPTFSIIILISGIYV